MNTDESESVLSNKLSNKYQYLRDIEALGITTPKTLLIPDQNSSADYQQLVQDFIAAVEENNTTNNPSRYIVRSMNYVEDGELQSYAGHFWSSDAIVADDIIGTINIAFDKNHAVLKQLELSNKPQLMLQAFVEHSIGGVFFAPWGFFSEYYYVEYSENNVQEVVSGKSQAAILNLHSKHPAPLDLPMHLQKLEAKFSQIITTLNQYFDFPIDCEWAYDQTQDKIIILQLRPQTHSIGAIERASAEIIQQQNISHSLEFTALSESLGNLSPLSFSLLESLYQDNLGAFQSLGFKAKQVDFFSRLPDGTVLIESQKEKAFYSSTFTGGFWKTFRAPKWQQESITFIKQNIHELGDKAFSYQTLSTLFKYWTVANILSEGAGREYLTTHSYELSEQVLIKSRSLEGGEFQIHSDFDGNKTQNWESLNIHLKELFFLELNKLKSHLSTQKGHIFCLWKEYIRDDFSQAQQRQNNDALLARYDFAQSSNTSNKNETDEMRSLSVRKKVTGSLFIIDNPARFHQNFPTSNTILLCPYFDNRWAHHIQHLKGIIVLSGNQLSHAAIVAREHKVPFVVINEKLLTDIKSKLTQGDEVLLDTLESSISLVNESH